LDAEAEEDVNDVFADAVIDAAVDAVVVDVDEDVDVNVDVDREGENVVLSEPERRGKFREK
jgi:hypothetical protein